MSTPYFILALILAILAGGITGWFKPHWLMPHYKDRLHRRLK